MNNFVVCSRVFTPVILLALASCRRAPEMTEFVPHYEIFSNGVNRVPVILVGVVLSKPAFDAFHPARYDSAVMTRRCRLMVRVENVLQGVVYATSVNISFFMSEEPITGSGQPFNFQQGERDIFFLQQDYGELRMIRDTASNGCLVKVFSGRHPNFNRDPSRPVWESIINLLLTRGEGISDLQMAEAVHLSGGWPGNEFDQPALTRALQQLARNEPAAVAEAACVYLESGNLPCPKSERLAGKKAG